MQFHGNVGICLVLLAGSVSSAKVAHDLKHEMSSSSSFLINQEDAGGNGLDDDRMSHLTDSIQGLFDAQASLDSRTGSDDEVLQIVKRDARNKVEKSPIAKPAAAIVVKAAEPTQVKAAAKLVAAKFMAAVAKPAQGQAVAKPPAAKVVKSVVVAPTPVKAIAKPTAAKVEQTAVAKPTQIQMKAAPKHPAAKVVKAAKPTQVKATAKPAAAKVVAAVAKPAQGKAVAKPPAAKVVKSGVVAPTPVKAFAKPTAAEVVKAAVAKPTQIQMKAAPKHPVVKAAKPTQVKAAAKPAAAKVIAAVAKPAQGKAVAKPPAAKVVKSAVVAPTLVKSVAKPRSAKVVKTAVAKPTQIQMKAAPKHPAAKVVKTAKPTQVKAAAKPAAAKAMAAVAKPAQGRAVAKPSAAKVRKSAAAATTPVKAVAKPAAKVGKPSVAKLAQKKVSDKVAAAATAKLARAVAKLAHKKVVAPKQQQQPKVAQTAVKPKPRKPVAHIATKVSRNVVKPVMKNSQTKGVAKVAVKSPHSKLANVGSKTTQPKKASKLVNTTHKVSNVAKKLPQTMVPKVRTLPEGPKVVNAVATLSQRSTSAKVQPTVKRLRKAAVKRVAKVKAPLVKAAPLKGAKHAMRPVAKVVAKTVQTKAAKVVAKRPQPSVVAKEHARVGAKLPVSVEKKHASSDIQPTISKPIAKVQVAASRHIKVVVNMSNTLLHGLHTAVNASVASNLTGDNKTKVLEEAVVSLPMASFALDIHQGNATKPKPKFPGNATQKKAWDKKEEALEHEIVALRTRLNKVNATPARPAKPATPAAAGTFNSHLAGNADTHLKASTKLVAAKGPAPMEPIRQQEKPTPTWPTMTSVAGPVSLRNVHSDVVPPQKEAIAEQNGKLKKVMGSTFTGTPAKKVQSVMALDAVVEHSVFDPDASSIPWFSQCEKWVSSFFARVFKSTGSRYPSASAISSAPHQVPRPAASLLDTTLRTPAQDMERTALSTKAEAQHVIALGSVWGDMEEADKTQEEEVRMEDEAERQRAVKVAPWKASKAELRGRHGPDMSAFWGTLETQDTDIVKSVSFESGSEYDRLTKEQDDLVRKAAKQLTKNDLHTDREPILKHNDPAFLSKTLHDTWESLETKDKALEKRIHDSPDLQMLQLDHQWHSLK